VFYYVRERVRSNIVIWSNLVNDPQVELGVLEQSDSFRQFVEEELPFFLDEILGETLTLETLMEAQHRCVAELARNTILTHKKFEKIRSGLSQFRHAKIFLDTLGIPEDAYWQQRPGLRPSELQDVKNGYWTVKDLLKRRPALILAPVLRPTTFLNWSKAHWPPVLMHGRPLLFINLK